MATRRDETHINSGCLTIRRTRYRSGEQPSRLGFFVALVGTAGTFIGLFLTAIGTINIHVGSGGHPPPTQDSLSGIEPSPGPTPTVNLGTLLDENSGTGKPDQEPETNHTVTEATECNPTPGDLTSLQNAISEVLRLKPHGYQGQSSIEELAVVLINEDPTGRFVLTLRGHGDSEVEAQSMADDARRELTRHGVPRYLCGTTLERIHVTAGATTATGKMRTTGESLLKVYADIG